MSTPLLCGILVGLNAAGVEPVMKTGTLRFWMKRCRGLQRSIDAYPHLQANDATSNIPSNRFKPKTFWWCNLH